MTCVQGVVPGTAGPNLPAGTECRVWERHTCELPTACQPLAARSDSEMHWRGEVRDISVGGVGLVLERRYEPGTVLSVVLGGDLSREAKPLLARVVHARGQDGRRWLLGCAFLSRLSTDQLNSLLHPEPPPPAVVHANGRAVPSGVVPKPLVIQRVFFNGTYPSVGRVAFAARRLHVTSGWPADDGTSLLLRLSEREPARIRIRVRTCAARGDGWMVAYEFLEPPSPAALRVLGLPGTEARPNLPVADRPPSRAPGVSEVRCSGCGPVS